MRQERAHFAPSASFCSTTTFATSGKRKPSAGPSSPTTELGEMHRFRIRIARKPCFFSGEGQHGRKPCDEAIEQLGDDRQRCTALQRRRRVTIKRVLSDVE